jgi:hypothetical protein
VTIDAWVGLLTSVAVLAYLAYTLIHPTKF